MDKFLFIHAVRTCLCSVWIEGEIKYCMYTQSLSFARDEVKAFFNCISCKYLSHRTTVLAN